jgi:hypothetical protein
MADAATYRALSRQCAETARYLLLLADNMDTASFHADGLPPDQLREIATTLRGAAMRAAMAADDTALLSELTGRPMRALHRDEEF